MEKISTKKMVVNGMMIALVFLVTKFAGFVMPLGGYFNVGDAVIMTAAILLGRKSGFVAGAFGSALSDAFTPGFLAFAPITFVVKGLEGYVVAVVANYKGGNSSFLRAMAVLAGAGVMIAGYFLGEAFILGAIDPTYGLAYALRELAGTNLLQGVLSSILGYILSTLLAKANVKKYAIG